MHARLHFRCDQLLDSGATRNLVSTSFVKRMNLKTARLKQQLRLQYMDGEYSQPVQEKTTQTFWIEGRTLTMTYLVADISEDIVLGLQWLEEHDPLIGWKTQSIEWRDSVGTEIPIRQLAKALRARAARSVSLDQSECSRSAEPVIGTQLSTLRSRKARKRIVQDEIKFNDPPAWVLMNHADALGQRKPGTLPPRRPGWDYKVTMKPDFVPRKEKGRRFSPEERRMFEDLARVETNNSPDGWRWTKSKSPQCSQMLWAAKAGGEKRPCTDYRRLNSGMIDDGWPLPKVKDMIDDAAGKPFLSSLDIPKAYYELRTDPETKWLLAFQCGDAQYEPEVMQFGTKTAVQWWQRFLCHVLEKHWKKGVHVYLDNILVYADTQEAHDKILRDVLKALEANQLTVNEKKCEWSKNRVQFCGFSIGESGILMDDSKVAAIQEWQIPHDAKISEGEKRTAVREFLGFTNFCKELIPDYSEIAAPLTELTKPKLAFRWTEREERAFLKLKDAFTKAPVVMPFVDDAPKEIFTDASDTALGGVVCQRVNGKLQVIAFWSKKLSDTEKRYSVHDRELMALRTCLVKHRHWLHNGQTVVAWTDHSALRHFMKSTEWKDRQVRWGNDMGEFNLEIRHLPGRSNRAADALSRKHFPGTGKKEREESILKEEWWATKCEACQELERRAAKVCQQVRQEGGTSWDCAEAMRRQGLTV